MSKDLSAAETEYLSDTLIGKTIAGRYKIESVIGDGGYGRVYRAEHITLNMPVAVKVIHQHLARDQERLKRLDQEAKSLSKLNSPFVVKTLDYGLSPIAYLVMEFVDATPLNDFLKSGGQLEFLDSITFFEQLCRGLATAHSAGLVHRDLKPGNILLSRANNEVNAKILDFGIAKVLDDAGDGNKLTATGEIMGSPAYMSPEQWTAREIDQRSDIYSLGCVMYEFLTGVPPYQADSSFEYLHLHLNQELKPFSVVAPERKLSKDLELIVKKCTQKDPSDRYGTTSDIIHDLDKIRGGKELKIKIANAASDNNNTVRFKPLTRWFLSALLVVFVLSFGIAIYKRDDIMRQACLTLNYASIKQAREGKIDDAINNLRLSMSMAEYLPKQDLERMNSMRALSYVLKRNGAFAESADIDKRIDLEIGHVDPPRIRSYLQSAVNTWHMRHDYRQSAYLANSALAMAASSYGKHTQIYSKCLQILGSIQREAGDLKSAEVTLQQSLRILEDFLDPMDRQIGQRLNDLGLVLDGLGRHAQAEAAFFRAIKIGEVSRDPQLAVYYNNLAAVYQMQKEYDKALKMSEKAFEIDSAHGGKISVSILTNMGVIYFQTGKNEKALECFRKATEICKTDGVDHSKSGEDPITSLAVAYRRKRDYENALLYINQSLAEKLARKWPQKRIDYVRQLKKEIETEKHDVKSP